MYKKKAFIFRLFYVDVPLVVSDCFCVLIYVEVIKVDENAKGSVAKYFTADKYF